MTDSSRIVTPAEVGPFASDVRATARMLRRFHDAMPPARYDDAADIIDALADTIVTAPDREDARTRAAVVKALSDVAATLDPDCARVVMGRADAFRRGERDL